MSVASNSMLGSLRRLLRASGLIWAFLLLCLVATLISPHFVQPANPINVLRQIALFGTISVGMTLVILTKGIDLSVGSLVGIDGQNSAFEAIKDGKLAATFIYPFVAPEGIQYAYRVAKGEPVSGEILIEVQGVNADNIDDFLGKGF